MHYANRRSQDSEFEAPCLTLIAQLQRRRFIEIVDTSRQVARCGAERQEAINYLGHLVAILGVLGQGLRDEAAQLERRAG